MHYFNLATVLHGPKCNSSSWQSVFIRCDCEVSHNMHLIHFAISVCTAVCLSVCTDVCLSLESDGSRCLGSTRQTAIINRPQICCFLLDMWRSLNTIMGSHSLLIELTFLLYGHNETISCVWTIILNISMTIENWSRIKNSFSYVCQFEWPSAIPNPFSEASWFV